MFSSDPVHNITNMSLDTLPQELLVQILRHIPPTPCKPSFNYSFSVTNQKPLKPHRVYHFQPSAVFASSPLDYWKYDIYSEYISACDFFELALACKHLYSVVFPFIFTDVSVSDRILLPAIFQRNKQSSFMPWRLNLFGDKNPPYTLFLRNEWFNPGMPFTGINATSRILANTDIVRWIRDLSLELLATNHDTIKNFMNTSLDTVHIPFLRSIRFSVQDYYAWSDGLAQNLATRLAKFSSPVVLDIALEYIAVWDALDSISQHLGAALRRLKLKSSLMAANVATLDPDVFDLTERFLKYAKRLTGLHRLVIEDSTRQYNQHFPNGIRVGYFDINPIDILNGLSALNIRLQMLSLKSFSPTESAESPQLVVFPDSVRGLIIDNVTWDQLHMHTLHMEQLCFTTVPMTFNDIFISNLHSLSLSGLSSIQMSDFWLQDFFERNGKTIKRLYVDSLPLEARSIKSFLITVLDNCTSLTQFECCPLMRQQLREITTTGAPQVIYSLNEFLWFLKREAPDFCQRVEYLSFPVWPNAVNFRTLHGLVTWVLEETDREEEDEDEDSEHNAADSTPLFKSLKRFTLFSESPSPEPFFTNKFLADHFHYFQNSMPYLFSRVAYAPVTPWRIFGMDGTCPEDTETLNETIDSKRYLEGSDFMDGNDPVYLYDLHLEVLRDIEIHINQLYQVDYDGMAQGNIRFREWWYNEGHTSYTQTQSNTKYEVLTSRDW